MVVSTHRNIKDVNVSAEVSIYDRSSIPGYVNGMIFRKNDEEERHAWRVGSTVRKIG